jgi:hypothetical protein
MWFRKQEVPKTNETKQVDAVKLWIVQWRSISNSYTDDDQYCHVAKNVEICAFTTKQLADDFVLSLKNAMALLKDTRREIKVTEQS